MRAIRRLVVNISELLGVKTRAELEVLKNLTSSSSRMRVRVSSGQTLGPGREWLWHLRVTVIRAQ